MSEVLRKLFPNASSSIIKRNPDFGSAVSNPLTEPAVRPADLSNAGKKENPRRCAVRIISCRRYLLDPDNLCPKFFIDALRYENVIPGDSAKHIVYSIEQRKVERREEERTIIEITLLP